jgi:hypothetical protein
MLGNMLSNLNQNMKVAFNICLLCETCILLLLLLLFPSALVLSPRPPTITYYFATLCVRGGVLLECRGACNESQRLHAASNILSMTKLTLG